MELKGEVLQNLNKCIAYRLNFLVGACSSCAVLFCFPLAYAFFPMASVLLAFSLRRPMLLALILCLPAILCARIHFFADGKMTDRMPFKFDCTKEVEAYMAVAHKLIKELDPWVGVMWAKLVSELSRLPPKIQREAIMFVIAVSTAFALFT